jgi:hypothetical protein
MSQQYYAVKQKESSLLFCGSVQVFEIDSFVRPGLDEAFEVYCQGVGLEMLGIVSKTSMATLAEG